jgi:LuxR family maltose regulon positive regulatory protein
VHSWRLRGDLTEIGVAQLAFTASETAELLAHDGVDLTDDQAATMRHRHEGWPAGLRLAGAAARRDLAGAAGPDTYLTEYLTREVLGDQPEHLRQVLQDTAILPRLCAGLVDAVTGRADGGRLLKEMLDANLFLIAIDAQPGWYRYQSSFANLMRTELATQDPAWAATLHRRAGCWFIEHDLPLEALRHAVAGEDWTLAGNILRERWRELLGYDYRAPDGSVSPPLRLPGGAVLRQPEVALAYALERLTRGDPDTAARLLRLAGPNSPPRLVAAAIDLTCARQRGAIADQRTAALRMLDLLSSHDGPSCDEAAGAIALTALGRTQLAAGELDHATVTLRSSLELATRSGSPGPKLAALSTIAVVRALNGELHAAERAAHAALAMPAGPGDRRVEDAKAHLALAVANLHWDRLEESCVEIGHALDSAAQAADPDIAIVIAIVNADLLRERGDLAEGLMVLRAARHAVDAWSAPPHLLHWLDAAEADMTTAHGDAANARLLLRSAHPTGDDDRARHAVALARTYLGEGDPAAAVEAVTPWTDDRRDTHCPVQIRLDAALVGAVAAHRLTDTRQAALALERALRLAEPDGFRRAFVGGGPELHGMLLNHLDSGTAYWSLVTNLVAIGRADGRPHIVSAPCEPLSERELTVLRYLQSILSNAEIATEMCISINTVKTHIRNIYRKLDAGHRRDAVRRARGMQLL